MVSCGRKVIAVELFRNGGVLAQFFHKTYQKSNCTDNRKKESNGLLLSDKNFVAIVQNMDSKKPPTPPESLNNNFNVIENIGRCNIALVPKLPDQCH